MAVGIKFVFDMVSDLTRKDKAGYMSADEFNRSVAQAQDVLMQFYYQQYEDTQRIVDSLMPFVKALNIPISTGYCDFPEDYRHRLEVGYLYIQNSEECGGGEPTIEPYPMTYLNANEEMETLRSAIRKPSIPKRLFYHSFVNNKIKVFPQSLTGYIHFKYIQQPPAAIYGVTLDVANDQENYNPATSVDFIWNDQDAHHLVDLLLLFKGIAIRETALLEWIKIKQGLTGEAP